MSLKKMSIPKIAVLATGAAAALLAATINPSPVAQATPSEAAACTTCHTAGGSVTATPAAGTQAPGASYTVALAFTGGTGSPAGFWISGNTASVTGSSATSATMTAPATAGTYTYTVWVRSGSVASTTYSITVAGAAVAPPAVAPPAVAPAAAPPAAAPPAAAPPAAAPAVAGVSAVIPVGAPDTGAGGTAN